MSNLKIVQTQVIENRLEYARQLDQQAKQSIFQLIASLKIINDENLFVELGYNSMKDYCQQSLNQSYTLATMYLQIANKFGEYVGSNVGVSMLTPGMDYTKLYQLSRLPEEQISELMHKGEVAINGSTLSMETIKNTSRENLAKIISSAIYEDAPSVHKTEKGKPQKSLTETKMEIIKAIEKLDRLVFYSGSDEIKKAFDSIFILINAAAAECLEK